MRTKMISKIVLLCVSACLMTCLVQWLFGEKMDMDVLTYVVPACIVSYVLGMNDAKGH